jgi:hypothetical protein
MPLIALALATVPGCTSSPSPVTSVPTSQVEVVFDHPDKFLDIRDRNNPTDAGEKEVMATLRDYIVQRAPRYLSPGSSLKITFVDVKLAGVFRIGGLGDRRVVLSTTPPLFKFSWSVTDRTGRVVDRAREILDEPDFKDLFSDADEGDPYRYEKAVLDDWMRNRLQS